MKQNNGYGSLLAYQKAFQLAMDIYRLSSSFPPEEKFSLTDQIRRSSRSVCTNIGEGYRKRLYPKHFISKLTDADGEMTETQIWLYFALSCEYITEAQFTPLMEESEQAGKLIGNMIRNPGKFGAAQ